jgi:two-component system, cell cycle response regulator
MDEKDRSRSPDPAGGSFSGPAPSNPSGTIRMDAADLWRYCQNQSFRGSLLVIAGSKADIGNHLLVETAVVIGREPTGLQLHDGGISRSHATVERRENDYLIRDLGSTNGTLVNGSRLQGEVQLREGDKILLGQTVIKFTMVDETEAAYLRQVAHLVGTDDLTGLMSKHRFDAALKEWVKSCHASGAPLSAMMMDMDGLKAVNDRHGHQTGAETIRQVGGLIGRLLLGRGEACRFGGDEFSAFLPAINLEQALLVAEQIRRGVETLGLQREGQVLAVTISIGVVERAAGISDFAVLMHQADEALYRAKARGKNVVCT